MKRLKLTLMRLPVAAILLVSLVGVYIAWYKYYPPLVFEHQGTAINLPLPDLRFHHEAIEVDVQADQDKLHPKIALQVATEQEKAWQRRRRATIDKVKAFLESQGSSLAPYASILVDKSEYCGGNYKVLIGIAGSESGLGKINYKQYNPFGFLNGVQYPDYETALRELSCLVSQNHISICGTDLYCLANRYAGPQDDKDHFVFKIKFFIQQLDSFSAS